MRIVFNCVFTLVGLDLESGYESSGDILVTRSQSYTGDTPWSLQHLGCGHQGTWVSLTQAYILTARHRGLDSSAVWLMREWIKFKFGVFEELRGFAGDDLYNDTYSVGEDIRRMYGCSSKDSKEEDNMFCEL